MVARPGASPGATFTAVSRLINTPTPTGAAGRPHSSWLAPRPPGPGPGPAPGSRVLTSGGRPRGEKLGHRVWRLCGRRGALLGRFGGRRGVPQSLLATRSQAPGCGSTRAQAGLVCPGHWALSYSGLGPPGCTGGPLPGLTCIPRTWSPHSLPQRAGSHGTGAVWPWAACAVRSQARLSPLGKEKGLSQSFSLKRKINYFSQSPAPAAQDFVPDPGRGEAGPSPAIQGPGAGPPLSPAPLSLQ